MAAAVCWKKDAEAKNYSQSRPDYPVEVVDISIKYLREHFSGNLSQAIDIGCGTGKSTEHLIPYFDKVVGCDPSEAMLQEARHIFADQGMSYVFHILSSFIN